MRLTIYLSERRDKDLVKLLKEYDRGDYSLIIRELMRKGMKSKEDVNTIHTRNFLVQPSNVAPDFRNVEVGKKVLTTEELDRKLNNI